ncbi:MAG: DUF4358 domain-containing protein [Bacillota bacterium]|nr:DUF4358 domain-containing protein [Bacillota bacterium]
MKRVICVLLALTMMFVLCACGGNSGDSGTVLETSVKDFIAAVQQNSGAKAADKLVGMEDDDFAVMLNMYLGIDAGILSDGAMAIPTSTAANEIIVLCVEDSDDVATVKKAYEDHVNQTIMSDERYFPENVALLEQAVIYENGNYVMLIVDENMALVKSAMDQLFSAQDLIPSLAEDFYTAEPVANDYDYDKPVPGRETVGSDWFSDAMFIGDSRMKGIMNNAESNGWFTPGADLSLVGLTVSNIYTEYVTVNGQSMTVADGIKQSGKFTKCYILLGINELGWGSSERFIECYKELVGLVKSAHPEAQIYIIGNMPLGDKAVESGDWLTNDNVVRFNEYIKQVASEEEVYYIDAYNLLQVDGRLPADAANDGIHVQPEVSKQLVEYLMSHTVG